MNHSRPSKKLLQGKGAHSNQASCISREYRSGSTNERTHMNYEWKAFVRGQLWKKTSDADRGLGRVSQPSRCDFQPMPAWLRWFWPQIKIGRASREHQEMLAWFRCMSLPRCGWSEATERKQPRRNEGRRARAAWKPTPWPSAGGAEIRRSRKRKEGVVEKQHRALEPAIEFAITI